MMMHGILIGLLGEEENSLAVVGGFEEGCFGFLKLGSDGRSCMSFGSEFQR